MQLGYSRFTAEPGKAVLEAAFWRLHFAACATSSQSARSLSHTGARSHGAAVAEKSGWRAVGENKRLGGPWEKSGWRAVGEKGAAGRAV